MEKEIFENCLIDHISAPVMIIFTVESQRGIKACISPAMQTQLLRGSFRVALGYIWVALGSISACSLYIYMKTLH